MKFSESIKPISYFKAHAAEVIKEISDNRGTLIITQIGEAKAIVQDIRSYEETQADIAMLKIIAMGQKEIEAGRGQPATDVFRELYNKIDLKEAE